MSRNVGKSTDLNRIRYDLMRQNESNGNSEMAWKYDINTYDTHTHVDLFNSILLGCEHMCGRMCGCILINVYIYFASHKFGYKTKLPWNLFTYRLYLTGMPSTFSVKTQIESKLECHKNEHNKNGQSFLKHQK